MYKTNHNFANFSDFVTTLFFPKSQLSSIHEHLIRNYICNTWFPKKNITRVNGKINTWFRKDKNVSPWTSPENRSLQRTSEFVDFFLTLKIVTERPDLSLKSEKSGHSNLRIFIPVFRSLSAENRLDRRIVAEIGFPEFFVEDLGFLKDLKLKFKPRGYRKCG